MLFAQLDDVDILSAVKEWQNVSDLVLSMLCKMIINRKLLHIKVKNKPINEEKLTKHLHLLMENLNLSSHEASYFVFSGVIENQAYDQQKQPINILKSNGKITDVVEASDQLNLKMLSKKIRKYYMCYPKLYC
jgi:hypothetical protein